MRGIYTILAIALLLSPISLWARESMASERVKATIEDDGSWELTDNKVNVTWQGQWINERLMKVTGSDNSCFIIGENEAGLVQLDCKNLREISILLSYER